MRNRSLILLLAAVLVAAFVLPLAAKSGTNKNIKGTFDLIIRGSFEGTGKAHVVPGPKPNGKVNWISCNIKNTTTGATGSLVAKNLTLEDDGRFTGMGQAIGQDVKIVGRVEVPDNALITRYRIMITFCTVAPDGVTLTGEAGRALGEK